MTPAMARCHVAGPFQQRAKAIPLGYSARIRVWRFGRRMSPDTGVTSQGKSSARNCIGAMSAGDGTENADSFHLGIT
jgi:hypothetical protein